MHAAEIGLFFQRKVPLTGRRLRQTTPPKKSNEVDFQPRRDVKMQWYYFMPYYLSHLVTLRLVTVTLGPLYCLTLKRQSEMMMLQNDRACCPR